MNFQATINESGPQCPWGETTASRPSSPLFPPTVESESDRKAQAQEAETPQKNLGLAGVSAHFNASRRCAICIISSWIR